METNEDRRRTERERSSFAGIIQMFPANRAEGAYTCEALDLSAYGMRMRTAYLPTVGQQLECRFEVGGADVSAQAHVIWRREHDKGGEFGVGFSTVDGPGAALLHELMGERELSAQPTVPRAAATVDKGSRVRLHIDGMEAPMRARVRDADTGAILVGSSLEFLRVGRPLHLENVEQGKTRSAVVDRVGVEVDPASQVPQLVIRLRYEEAKPTVEPRAKATAPTDHGVPSREADASPPPMIVSKSQPDPAAEPPYHESDVMQVTDDDFSLEEPWRGKAQELAHDVREHVRVALSKVTQGWATMVGSRWSKDGGEDQFFRQTTEVPPQGVGTSRGRRRAEFSSVDESADLAHRRRQRRRLGVAGGVGSVAIVLGFLLLRGNDEPVPGTENSLSAQTNPAGQLPVTAMGATPPAVPTNATKAVLPASDVVQANVPLYGPTPLSTLEAVAPPAPLPSVTATLAGVALGAGDAAVALPASPSTAGSDAQAHAAPEGAAGGLSYGRGKVRNPHTVRLKMDSPIEQLRGSVGESSLTISVPGRHNIEPATTLAKNDKRLVAVKATPNGNEGTDVTLVFRDAVPPFLAKADGKMLEVELGDSRPEGDGDEGRAHKRHARKTPAARTAGHGKESASAHHGKAGPAEKEKTDSAKGHKKDKRSEKEKSHR